MSELDHSSGRIRLRSFAAATVLLGATVAAYWPALRGGFIWDDDGHVTRPDLRSWHGLERIWFDLGATQQYYPLLHSAFWLEHRWWGDAAVGYHLTNVLLHVTAACLFGLVLRRLAVPGAGIAALVFALHPVEVESVAWISEQKNTLSTVFYLLAALAYLRFRPDVVGSRASHESLAASAPERKPPGFREAPGARTNVVLSGDRFSGPYPAAIRFYVLATAFFAMALLTKTVTATLPAALLVVVWWKKGSISWKRDIVPLVPWFGLAAAAGTMTAWIERTYVGAQGARFDLSAVERGLLAARAVCFYLGKILWPGNLVFIYPRWIVDSRIGWQYFFLAGVVAAGAILFLLRRRWRGPLAAFLFFAGSLFPALGFFNVYPFTFSYVADHFQYLASLGVIAFAAAGLGRLGERSSGGGRAAVWGLVLAVAATLGTLTWRQAGTYRDLETVFQTTLDRNPGAWLAHDNLGVLRAREGRLTEAVEHYRAAVRLNPDFPETYNNLGTALARLGRRPEAEAAFAEAVRLKPDSVKAEANWANLLSDENRYPEAETHFGRALRLQPEDAEAHYGLANVLANSERLAEAIPHYREALRLRPNYPEAHANLGLAFATGGRWNEALAELTEAVRLRPNYPEAHAYLGFALAGAGRTPEAVGEYREALRLHPDNPDVHYQLGMALRALGQTAEAEQELEAARRPR